MNFVILVNGSINAGKSTVSRELCRLRPRMAHVEVDDLRGFIGWMPLVESIPLNLKNAAAVGRNFLEYGLDIVISYPLNRDDYEYLVSALKPYPVYSVTLMPPLSVAQTNRGGRELESGEVERIAVMYQDGVPEFETMLIDNSETTPAETASLILQSIGDATADRK